MIWLNQSKVLQSITVGGRSMHLPPRWSISVEGIEAAVSTREVSLIKDVKKVISKNPSLTLGVARRGGLGDVIMLLPVLRVLLELYPSLMLKLYTTSRHAKFLEHTQTDRLEILPDSRIVRDHVDLGISLEGVVEKDHCGRGGQYATMPRHSIFAEVLGILSEVQRQETRQNFSIVTTIDDVKRAAKMLSGISRPIVGLQVRGNELSRTLPLEQVIELVQLITRLGYAVIPLDSCMLAKLKGEYVYQFPSASLREVLEIIKRCKFLITMESGLLHMGHVADAPLICFYGPTRVEERGTFHPSFSKGWVIPIKLNELFNCRPCFMRPVDCGWRYRCIRQTPTPQLLQAVEESILKMQSILDHDRQ
jgi:ADP-heptose:LPS heptosyltransferase